MNGKIYAITGGIGSGKSLVTSYINSKGYATFSADKIYEELLKNEDFVREIYNLLQLSYKKGDVFDRKLVSSVVFSDKTKLKLLNDLTHAKIMQKMLSLSKNQNKIVFNEVPLLFESGYEDLYDGVIVVLRDKEERIKSVIERDGKSRSQVEDIIKNQFNYDNISQKKHILIVNDGNVKSLQGKVDVVLSEIEKKSS
ncbi:MAG: dephospho-CoA kinase [Clostridia bacterium]|nr:dephospho-CoA kinase [Clostridia bacterium]